MRVPAHASAGVCPAQQPYPRHPHATPSQLVAYPLETISRRMQLGALPPATAAASHLAAAPGAAAAAAAMPPAAAAGPLGAWQIAAQIVREGGVRGLYAGVGAATLRLVPMAVVSFGVYECMRAVLVEVGRMRRK
jgi:solute carrier family 25 phosphate transporter 23/24/25/41